MTRLTKLQSTQQYAAITRLIAYLLLMLVGLLSPSGPVIADEAADNTIVQDKRHYTYIYWENGYPTREVGRRPQAWANTVARANPDLVVQTGYYSLVLDAKTLELEGYDAVNGSDYVTALHQDVTQFTPAALTLKAYQDGVEYTATSGIVQDGSDSPVRLIESGQFLQRYDHLGIKFTAEDGTELNVPGRLEISAWPEHVVFKLDFANFEGTAVNIDRTVIELTSPAGKHYNSYTDGIATSLSVRPHDDLENTPLNPADIVTASNDLQKDSELAVVFDTDTHALKVNLPITTVRFPEHNNRVDEFEIEVTNPTQSALDVPLVFEEEVPRAITGTVMLLTDATDGKPSGIPVQISKNWHVNADTGVKAIHRGYWLRGSTYLTLAPGETKRLKLKVIFGYWAAAGAASHAQLSLVGWGGNWKWDESALGAWGESMTYDPVQHLGSAFMDDIRPTFTPPMNNGTTHNWTENVGGGDFLIYFDGANKYRWAKRLKTAYVWTGPNMTKVMYSGVTDDDKIRFEYVSKLVSTNDYHRRLHNYRYQFQQDVVDPKRLVFYQMAGDWYIGPDFNDFYVGDATGLQEHVATTAGGNTYKGKFSFSDRWLASNDILALDNNSAKANRGIIQRSSTLNGNDFPVFMHKYGRSWGKDKMLFDLAGESVERSYNAGDVVEGEFEFIMPAKQRGFYWGADTEFADRLSTYTAPWQAVFDEYRHNNKLQVTAHTGTLLNNFPIEIDANTNAASLLIADLTMHSGGLGHVPIIIKNADIGRAIKVQRLLNGAWVALETNAATDNSYYQGYQNTQGKIDYAFSIQRPSANLSDSWRVRVLYEGLIDAIPDAFSFAAQTDVPRNAVTESNSITISGINMPVAVSISGGEYSINNGAYTSQVNIIRNGQQIKVRHTSANEHNTRTDTLLTIASASATFNSTTAAGDSGPDADADGVGDAEDNCPALSNPAQADADDDGAGDICDPDDDNDSLPDAWEISHNLDPLDPADAALDSDGDGKSNLQEFNLGHDPHFDERKLAGLLPVIELIALPSDHDDDGVEDALDNCSKLANAEQGDQDGDGFGDLCDAFPADAGKH